jgi:hypothetical protein
MQSLFPLYQELANSSQEPKLDNAKTSSLILLLEPEHCKNIYMLIFVHAHLSKKVKDVEAAQHTPYGGKFDASSSSVSFVLHRMPTDLQRVLRLYVERATSSE